MNQCIRKWNRSTKQNITQTMKRWRRNHEPKIPWTYAAMSRWINEGITESMHHRPSEAMNQWTNETINRRTNESIKEQINESINQCTSQSMGQWTNESMNHWINQRLPWWTMNQESIKWIGQWTDGQNSTCCAAATMCFATSSWNPITRSAAASLTLWCVQAWVCILRHPVVDPQS